MTSSTPSPLGGVSSVPSSPGIRLAPEKHRRYDRQLRLWGDHGQHALERSHVLLINATSCGTEVLKALVLPGCGAFTIVDEHKVDIADTGNNFFLDPECLGQPRGAVARRLLLELNHEVRGDSLEEDPEQLLRVRPDFFKNFTLVIVAELGEKGMKTLSKILWDANIPMIVVRAYGFIGYIRLQVREHTVIESHPDNEFEDLRLDAPFPTLMEHMKSYEDPPFSSMSKAEHSHIPYLVLLYKYLDIWKAHHDGLQPQNYKEKNQFKQLIRTGIRRNEDGIPEEEENFEEAVKAVNTSLHQTSIPADVKAILADPQAREPRSGDKLSSDDFWILCRALRDFVENEGNGQLPVRGSIPDMFSDSERYIALQNSYRDQAADDAAAVGKYVEKHLDLVGRPPESIREATIRNFCREAFHLKLIRTGCSIAEEMEGDSPNRSQVSRLFEEDPDSSLMYYFILRGVDRFFTEHNTLPGVLDVESDIGRLKGCVAKVVGEYGISAASGSKDDAVHEICRVGGAELHAVASVIGGCAAQEVIKLITEQFVPINNLFIFNGITSDSLTVQV